MVLRGFLKFSGGLFAALLILGVILGGVGYFAARNFDPNMFRAEFEKYLTQQTGFRVELGDIQFRWRPRPELQVAGLKFYHPQSLEKVLQSDRVRIDADLTSVWQKRLSMSRVVIRSPEIFLERSREGVWNWQTTGEPVNAAPVPPVRSPTEPAPAVPEAKAAAGVSLATLGSVAQGWEFGIGKILVQNAAVHFSDETIEPPFRLEIKDLEAEVRQKSSTSSFHFNASGTVFDAAEKNLEAEGDLDLISKALDLTLRYGPEKAMFKGLLKVINTMPHFEGALEIREMDMGPVIPAVYKKNEYVTGFLSTQAQLSFDGANPAIFQRSLKGQGTTGIRDGALKNRNVVQEVFDQLSPVVAITNALGGELPPELNEMLKDRDTPFQSLQVAYAVESGIIKVREFRLVHPNYQLTGKGTYGIPDKRVEGSMELLLSQSISAYMIKKIRELGMIADRNGQVMIPFRYSGVFPDTRVQPDLPYIAARILQGGADQLLSQGLERLSEIFGPKKTEQAPAEAPPASPGPAATTPAGGTGSTAEPVSKKKTTDQWIQEGLNLFTQIQKQEPSQP